MSALDRVRLAKLLGMLGSEHEGEVATAARMATEMLSRHDLEWDAVLSQTQSVRIERVEVVREVRVEVVREVMVPEPRRPGRVARLRLATRKFSETMSEKAPDSAKVLLKASVYPVMILGDYVGTVRQCFRAKLYVDVCLQAVIGGCSVSIAAALWGGMYYGLLANLIIR
jgi:hypothetical protein